MQVYIVCFAYSIVWVYFMTVNHGVPRSSRGGGAEKVASAAFFDFMYYLYIIFSTSTHIYYVGSTQDPWKRIDEHNSDPKDTFTSKYRPWVIKALFEAGKTRAEAIKIERFVKKQKSRKLIERLIDPSFVPDSSLAQLVRVPHVRD
jgi:putative endonuclease